MFYALQFLDVTIVWFFCMISRPSLFYLASADIQESMKMGLCVRNRGLQGQI